MRRSIRAGNPKMAAIVFHGIDKEQLTPDRVEAE